MPMVTKKEKIHRSTSQAMIENIRSKHKIGNSSQSSSSSSSLNPKGLHASHRLILLLQNNINEREQRETGRGRQNNRISCKGSLQSMAFFKVLARLISKLASTLLECACKMHYKSLFVFFFL